MMKRPAPPHKRLQHSHSGDVSFLSCIPGFHHGQMGSGSSHRGFPGGALLEEGGARDKQMDKWKPPFLLLLVGQDPPTKRHYSHVFAISLTNALSMLPKVVHVSLRGDCYLCTSPLSMDAGRLCSVERDAGVEFAFLQHCELIVMCCVPLDRVIL